MSISLEIEDSPDIDIDAGWWRVFHQSTDFFTIGRLTTPTKVIIETAVSADFLEAKVDCMPMIAK